MSTSAIILAAGKSTRMKSAWPKVLHPVCGKPMLAYAIDACAAADVDRIVIVVGFEKQQVIDAFADRPNLTFVEQVEQHGTAHAVLCAQQAFSADATGQILVLAGDMPLVGSPTIQTLLAENAKTGDGITLATTILPDPTGYGRIVRDEGGKLQAIVEHKDCTPQQLAITEANPSYYCFAAARMFDVLGRIKNDNAKGEYYITDAVRILLADGQGAGAVAAVPAEQATGINDRADLARVNRIMQDRIQADLMQAGVTITDPSNTWINSGVTIAADTVIEPFTFIDVDATIGAHCTLGPFAHIAPGSCVPDGQTISQSSSFAGAVTP